MMTIDVTKLKRESGFDTFNDYAHPYLSEKIAAFSDKNSHSMSQKPPIFCDIPLRSYGLAQCDIRTWSFPILTIP